MMQLTAIHGVTDFEVSYTAERLK